MFYIMLRMENIKKISNTRRVDIQLIRIISMFMIVICHTIHNFTFIPGSSILPHFFNVGVEVFLVLSGYLYGSKNINNFFGWFLKRLRKIALPASILSLVAIISFYFVFDSKYDLQTIFAHLLNFQGLTFLWNGPLFFSSIDPLGALWFIIVILICYLLIPFFQKVRSYVNSVNKLIIIVFLLIFLRDILLSTIHIEIVNFIAFFVGYQISYLDIKLENYNKYRIVLFAIFVLFFQALRVFLRYKYDGTHLYSTYTRISHLIFGIGLFLFEMWIFSRLKPFLDKISSLKILNVLDEYSFYIYLTHGIFSLSGIPKTNIFGQGFSLFTSTVVFLFATIISSIALKYIVLGIERLITLLFVRKNDSSPKSN